MSPLPPVSVGSTMELGHRLATLRDEGVLIIGSGFMTHGLPYLRDWTPKATPPSWSVEFDAWAAEAIARNDIDTLAKFAEVAPGMPYAHPTVEHFTPLFITLGTATSLTVAPSTLVDGYFMGLSKRSISVN
jgi:4,5-DOPA dioxygenase extradiol